MGKFVLRSLDDVVVAASVLDVAVAPSVVWVEPAVAGTELALSCVVVADSLVVVAVDAVVAADGEDGLLVDEPLSFELLHATAAKHNVTTMGATFLNRAFTRFPQRESWSEWPRTIVTRMLVHIDDDGVVDNRWRRQRLRRRVWDQL